MDRLEKISFPSKTSVPTMKAAEAPEDDDDNKVKTAKHYCVDSDSAKKEMSAANTRSIKSFEDDNFEVQHPNVKTKECSVLLNNFKATSERREEKMVETDEAMFSTIEGYDLAVFEHTEGCSKDAQWEIIQVPNTVRNPLPHIISFQNVLNATSDLLNGNQLVADMITNEARSYPRNREDYGCFTFGDDFERNDDLNKTKIDCVDFEAMDCDMNASEYLMEEIDNQKFQAGSSTMEENVRKSASKEFNINDLKHDRKAYSETPNNNIGMHYEELIKKRGKTDFSRDHSNLTRCRHLNFKNDLLPTEITRSDLNKTANKYNVTGSTKYVKSRRKEQKQLREVVMNSMEETHPDLHFEKDIAMRLQIFLWDMLYRIGDEAENLTMFSSKKAFDQRVLKYAVKLSLEKLRKELDAVGGKRK